MTVQSSNISLLQYVDDALFFGEWSFLNAINLLSIIGCFQNALRHKVYFLESKLYGVGVDSLSVGEMENLIKWSFGEFPSCYLGLSVRKNMANNDARKKVVKVSLQTYIFEVKVVLDRRSSNYIQVGIW